MMSGWRLFFAALLLFFSVSLPLYSQPFEPDQDHDRVADSRDNCPAVVNTSQRDSDRDGVGDLCDNCPRSVNNDQLDADHDGRGDACDRDDDNDGTIDDRDCAPLDVGGEITITSSSGGTSCVVDDSDDDNDEVMDSRDFFPRDARESVDTDRDGVGDNADPDDDGDGTSDISDCLPRSAAGEISIINRRGREHCLPDDEDDDDDRSPDETDAFPRDARESLDTDRDGTGDNADTDDDNDGVLDTADRFPRDPHESADQDRDGIGDRADPDDDNDGAPDTSDNCRQLSDPDQTDSDQDGLGNPCDPDDDNDGRRDGVDACPTDPDDTIGDPCNHDEDGDGVSDLTDNCPRLANPDQRDGDSNRLGDACDIAPTLCAPSDLRVTIRRCNDLRLEWRINPASCSTSEYRIYRDGVEWARRPSSQAILEDGMTIPAFTHEYRVVALDAGGLSQGENRLSVTTPECPPPPPLLRTKVLYFRFSDFPEEFTLPDGTLVNNTFFDNIVFSSPSGSLNAYLNEVSYNQTGVSGEVYGPFALPRLPSEYCSGTLPSGGHLDCSLPLIRTDVLSIVDPLIDFTGTDLVILAVNGLTGGYAAGSLSTNEDNENYFIVLGSSHYFTTSPGFANPTLVHELGHQIGNLFHAGAWRCPAGSGPGPNLDDLLEGGCFIERYGDPNSSMGVNSFHYNAYHKELLGFIRGTQITTVPGTSGVYEYTLDALEVVSDGIKEVKIPLSGGHFYFLEYRKPIELDSWTYFDGWRPIRDGVQVRLKVARLVSSDADTLFMNNSGLTVGVPFEDTYRGIRIELLEKSIGPLGLQARVRITRTAVP